MELFLGVGVTNDLGGSPGHFCLTMVQGIGSGFILFQLSFLNIIAAGVGDFLSARRRKGYRVPHSL